MFGRLEVDKVVALEWFEFEEAVAGFEAAALGVSGLVIAAGFTAST